MQKIDSRLLAVGQSNTGIVNLVSGPVEFKTGGRE